MLPIRPEEPAPTAEVAKARYLFATRALGASVIMVVMTMALTIHVTDDLVPADYALFAVVLACLAVLTPVAVVEQRRLLAKAVESGKRQG